MKKFFFAYRGKKISVDVIECKTFIQKGTGLMFRKDNRALLFPFRRKVNRAIHSFFCKPFIALWFNDKRIVDVQLVRPWQFSIRPKKKFNILLEIPVGNKFFTQISDEE